MIRFNGFSPSDEFRKLVINLEHTLDKASCSSILASFRSEKFVRFEFETSKSQQTSEIEFGVDEEAVDIKFIQILPNRTGLGSQLLAQLLDFAKNNNLKVRAIGIASEDAREIWTKLGFKNMSNKHNMELDPTVESEEVDDIYRRKINREISDLFKEIKRKKEDPLGLKEMRKKGGLFGLPRIKSIRLK